MLYTHINWGGGIYKITRKNKSISIVEVVQEPYAWESMLYFGWKKRQEIDSEDTKDYFVKLGKTYVYPND